MERKEKVMPMEKRVLSERLLPLSGVYNFREMGGMPAQNGKQVKRGLLFRSAELTGLTDRDKDYLQGYRIRYIYDYRDKVEADLRPDLQIADEKHLRVAVNGEDRSTAHSEWNPEQFYKNFSREKFTAVYAAMPIHNRSFQKMMSLLARPQRSLPFVHHCAGGRDRTGVGAMLILKTLGVADDVILDDYLLSNRTLASYHEELFAEAAHYISGTRLRQFESDFLLRQEYLLAAMHAIREMYGSFSRYLAVEFGITDTVRRKIQDFCLE
jgi:protein-tyrosine phosphatase